MTCHFVVHTVLDLLKTTIDAVRVNLRSHTVGYFVVSKATPAPPVKRPSADRSVNALQPLSAIHPLHHLAVDEPWLADPAIRAQCTWEQIGERGDRYAFYILRNAESSTVGILMREGQLDYCRHYPSYTLAAIDSLFWAREIQLTPPLGRVSAEGIDGHGRAWSLRVRQRRERHWELQIARGGLIPWTGDYQKLEDAVAAAAKYVRDLKLATNTNTTNTTATAIPCPNWCM